MFKNFYAQLLSINLLCLFSVFVSGLFLFPTPLTRLLILQAILFPSTNMAFWSLYSGKTSLRKEFFPKENLVCVGVSVGGWLLCLVLAVWLKFKVI